jgi:3-hydroxybutyryl-CoA dehydrogenase
MNILVVGNEINLTECKLKFGNTHNYELASGAISEEAVTRAEVVFDFFAHSDTSYWHSYEKMRIPIFLNTTYTSLAYLKKNKNLTSAVFGFCGLPSFLNRELLEVSMQKVEHSVVLERICNQLATSFSVVADRVGFVTPRIICMIINEAYYTVQEGTATRNDIDLAMKHGTNYPFGPFEWCTKIGIEQVYALLMAVYEDTKDERYKICSLLKSECLTV